jgi:paraquat-inducible protein B
MSAKTHPRLVGAFVLGAIALAMGAILALSSGRLFEVRDRFAVYFPGSVKGLGPGAAVTFRGIKIGEVVDVTAFLTGQPDPAIQIEVVIEFYGDVVEVSEGVDDPLEGLSTTELAEALIGRGIRARMLSASLLTGQRYIDFDFLPNEPARFAGLRPRYPELPTTPTAMEKMGEKVEEFMEKIAELPVAEMLEDVRKVIRSARELLDSPTIKGAFDSAKRSMDTLEGVLGEARTTMREAQTLIKSLDTETGQTAEEARRTLAETRDTVAQAEQTLATLEDTLRGADDARVTATRTFDELSRALKALRNLVDYIQTHPEAVVLGKQPSKEKK